MVKVNKNTKYDILIFSNPKTEGQTLNLTLNKKYQVYHTHNKYFFNGKYPGQENEILFNIFLKNNLTNKSIIISCYRTPIERLISLIFQNSNNNINNLKDFNKIFYQYVDNDIINETTHHANFIFNDNFTNLNDLKLINNKYNIYQLISKNNNKCYLFKFEELCNLHNILNIILNTNYFTVDKINKGNIGDKKTYASIYSKIKNKFKIQIEYLNKIINYKHIPIFFKLKSREEIINYYKFWYNKSIINTKTLVGKNGYLFLINDSNRFIENTFNPCYNFTEKDYSNLPYYKLIPKTNSKNNNCKLNIIIIPSKAIIQKQYLPSSFINNNTNNQNTKVNRTNFKIYSKIINDDLSLINNNITKLFDYTNLLNEKDYYKTDTHINLLGILKILKHTFSEFIDIKQYLSNLSILCKNDIKLRELNIGLGDLTWNTNILENNDKQKILNMTDNYYYLPSITSLYPNANIKQYCKINNLNITLFENYNFNNKYNIANMDIFNWDLIHNKICVIKHNKNDYLNDTNVLIYCDSNLIHYLPVLFKLFKKLVIVKSRFNNAITNNILKLHDINYIYEFVIEKFL